MQYSLLISYDDPETNKTVSIYLDTVNDTSVSNVSVVTTHPTSEGTPVSDHMYREPITLNVNGQISTNSGRTLIMEEAGYSLARVEERFEMIKNKGLKCTVTKISYDNNSQNRIELPQFVVRQNMVLKSIGWTEKINTLGFSFGFQEVLTTETLTPVANPDDNFLPNITYARSANFSDTFIDWDEVDKQILKMLYENKIVTDEFLNEVCVANTYLASIAIGLGITAVATGTTFAVVAATGVAIAAGCGPIGWAIAGLGALAIGIGAVVLANAEARKKEETAKQVYYKYGIQQFREGTDKEIKRFNEYYEKLHEYIRTIDTSVKLWRIPQNSAQETLLSINNVYFIFNFEKNNVDPNIMYNINVYDYQNVIRATSNINNHATSYVNYTDTMLLFKDGNTRVFLICIDEEHKDDLSNYYICASNIDPRTFTTTLTKLIETGIEPTKEDLEKFRS